MDQGRSHLFSSNFVKSLLDFKMLKSRKVTYAFMGSYIVYLSSLMFYRSRLVVAFWFILHLTEEIMQYRQNNGSDHKDYTMTRFHRLILAHFETLWNYFDFTRLMCMVGFIYFDNATFYSWLMMVSFLSFLKYLRAFPEYRIFIQLLIACIRTSIPFMGVLFIVMFGFTNTFHVSREGAG
jgi:hypothetical protein